MITCPIMFFLFNDFDYMIMIIISITNAFMRLKNFIDVYKVLLKYFSINLSNDKKDDTVTDTVASRTFLACLFVICLDNILFIFYVFPLSYGIYISKLQGGTFALVNWILICYLCDTGGLVVGKICGKENFGAPITPTKTREGIYGGFIFGFISSFLMKIIVQSLVDANPIYDDLYKFTLFTILCVLSAIFGDFFESFLKRCAKIKDSGILFPGHGGILDRIDSLALGGPITYFFFK